MMRPIVAADVEQFVAGNRGLQTRGQRCEALRKEHERREKAKSDGRIHLRGETELRRSSHQNTHCLENRTIFRRRGDGGGGLAETGKLEKADCKDGEAEGDSGENQDAESRSDRLKAGKMPGGSGGNGWRGKRNADKISVDDLRRTSLWAMPGLEEWERQANGEKRPPIGEKNAGLPKFPGAREKGGGKDQKSYLDVPESQIVKPQRHFHKRLLTSGRLTLICFPRPYAQCFPSLFPEAGVI